MLAITIDGIGSKDLDDAIWCVRRDGGYLIRVLVSNVADQVPLGSEWDERARNKQFSIYSGSRGCVNPMLPRSLSEGALSLIEGQSRNVVVYEIYLDDTLNVVSVEISTGTFENNNRLDPAAIVEILQDKTHPLNSPIALMSDVATRLLSKRRQEGSLAIYDIFSGWACDEDGVIRKLSDAEKNIGYVIVQEFMVLTNSIISEYCLRHNVPIMYRNHQVNIAAPAVSDLSSEIQHAFTAQDTKLITQISKRLALFAGKAVMSSKVGGHYGLNLPSYAYFTSPIRRYPDLVNQRNILAYLRGQSYQHELQDIEHLATVYNARVAQVQQESANFHAKKAREKGEGNLDRQHFTNLDGKELHQVIKIYIEKGNEQAPALLQHEILSRVIADNIEHKTLALLFFSGFAGFQADVKEQVISVLRPKPHHATSICNILNQKFGVGEIGYDYRDFGPDNNRFFSCKASCTFKERVISSSEQFSGVKKVAGQFAALDILQQLVDVRLSLSEKPAEKLVYSKPAPEMANTSPATHLVNPVGALQELCQKNKYSMPLYEHSKEGPDHMPTFSATVTVNVFNRELSGSCTGAPSKKEAAKLAAINLLNAYHSASGTGALR